jgi:hypothetical protein
MKAEQTVARLGAIFLLVFLFTGTKSFSQSLRGQEQTVREYRMKDSVAFDNYMARRGEIAAIKDSVEAENSTFGAKATRAASANQSKKQQENVVKFDATGLNSVQTVNNGRSTLNSTGFNFNAADSERRRTSNRR